MRPDRRSVADITADLRRLGVAAGDLVMVHASLRSLGPVEGGAEGLIDALGAAVGPEGTLLMTLGARDDAPFDCLVTAADPDMGALAEVFRQRVGTRVSDHPEGRFGASGPLADQLVHAVPWDDYYGPGSPLERLVEAGGRVLRLGADLDTLTVVHYAEYLVALPTKRRVRRHPVLAGPQGREPRVVECLDDEFGIVDHPGEDYFAVIMRSYLATGRASTGVVGRATSELIRAADVVCFAVAWMAEHLSSP